MDLASPRFRLYDSGSGVPSDQIVKVCAAIQRQILYDLAPAHGGWATIGPVTPDDPLVPDDIHMPLLPKLGVKGALGYHSDKADGTVFAPISPELCEQDGVAWSTTASHEVAEAMANIYLIKMVLDSQGQVRPFEIADAVEQDSYLIDGIAVSNFCHQAWYGAPGSRFDQMKLCKAPWQIRAGGYGEALDPKKGWIELGAKRPYRLLMDRLKLSRRARRIAMEHARG